MFMDNNDKEGLYDLYPQLRDFMGIRTEELDCFNDSNLTVDLENTAHDQTEVNPTTDHNNEPLITLNNFPAEQDTAQIDNNIPAQQTDQQATQLPHDDVYYNQPQQQTDQSGQAEKCTFLCEWDNEKCKQSFESKDEFALHVKQHGDTSARDQQLKEFVCTWKECGRGFQRKEGLVNHLRIHSDTLLKCSICPKTFITTSALQRHINDRHNKTKSSDLICKICGDSFSRKGLLANHIKNKHYNGTVSLNRESQQNGDEKTTVQTYPHSSEDLNNFTEPATTINQTLGWSLEELANKEEMESSESKKGSVPTIVLVFDDENNEHVLS